MWKFTNVDWKCIFVNASSRDLTSKLIDDRNCIYTRSTSYISYLVIEGIRRFFIVLPCHNLRMSPVALPSLQSILYCTKPKKMTLYNTEIRPCFGHFK